MLGNRQGTGMLPQFSPTVPGQLGYDPATRQVELGIGYTRNVNLVYAPGIGGTIFVVNPAGGADASTIQAGVDACVSGRGDIVYILPGSYDENVVIENKDYVTLVGVLGAGYARPDVVPTAGIALTVTASQGVYCQHMRFMSEDDDAVLNEGNGFMFADCVFDGALTASKGGIRLKGNATDDGYTASEGVIQNSLIRGNAIGIIFDTAEAAVGVGETDVTVQGNTFVGNTIDVATADTGPGTYSIQRGQIGPGNSFSDLNKTCYIDLTTSNGGAASDQTGVIISNTFATDAVTTTNVKMVGTGFAAVGNFDSAGIVDGTALD